MRRGHTHKPFEKREMKLKPQMQEPPGEYHVASCSTSTQAELIALILGFSQEDLNKNNAYLEAVHSIGLKNMGTACKWRDLTWAPLTFTAAIPLLGSLKGKSSINFQHQIQDKICVLQTSPRVIFLFSKQGLFRASYTNVAGNIRKENKLKINR